LNLAAHLSAIDTRHHIVQQNNVGLEIRGYLQRFLTSRGRLEVVVFTQQVLDRYDIDVIIIDGQNFVSRLYHNNYIGQKTTLF